MRYDDVFYKKSQALFMESGIANPPRRLDYQPFPGKSE